jgi:hypothetical protein
MKRKILGLLLILSLAVHAAQAEDCVHIVPPPQGGLRIAMDMDHSFWIKAAIDTNVAAGFSSGSVPGPYFREDAVFDSVGFEWDIPAGLVPPPDGMRVPVYMGASSACLYYAKVWVEYDSTLWNFVGYEDGPVETQFTFTTVNFDHTEGYASCSVSDESGHGARAMIWSRIAVEGCLIGAGSPRTKLVDFMFMPKENWADPDWAGWETTTAFTVACQPWLPGMEGLASVSLEFYNEQGQADPDYILHWGDNGLDLADANRCVAFDLIGGAGDKADYCSPWDVFRDCLSCPGCNYWGECWDDDNILRCQKWPCDPNQCPCNLVNP